MSDNKLPYQYLQDQSFGSLLQIMIEKLCCVFDNLPSGGGVESVTAENDSIVVNNTDPLNPVVGLGVYVKSVIGASCGNNTVTRASTMYAPIYGQSDFNGTENSRQLILSTGGTISNLYIATDSQQGDGSLVITINKNGVATALTLTIPTTSAAGVFSNTVLSASVSAGDVISVEFHNSAEDADTSIISYSFTLT